MPIRSGTAPFRFGHWDQTSRLLGWKKALRESSCCLACFFLKNERFQNPSNVYIQHIYIYIIYIYTYCQHIYIWYDQVYPSPQNSRTFQMLFLQADLPFTNPGTPNNQVFFNGCFNWMLPNHCIKNGCFTRHPLKDCCLGYQVGI